MFDGRTGDHHGVAPALCKQWPASPFSKFGKATSEKLTVPEKEHPAP
jgi:hypothetical protein